MILCLVTTFFFVQQGLCNVNIAINKTVLDCDARKYPKLVDGRMDTSHIISDKCGKEVLKIIISLEGYYFVHYVNLIEKECLKTHILSFEVHSLEGSVCGRYFNTHANCSTYRVNCIGVIKPSNTVVIELETGSMDVKEIEVFTLASGIANEDVMIYYGCFKHFSSTSIHESNNLKDCRRFCSIGNLFAAVEMPKGQSCHCSFQVNEQSRVVKTRCTDGCYPGDEECSRDDKYYSVYIIRVQLPHRYSCVENPTAFSNTISTKNMLTEVCIRHCDTSTFAMLMSFSSLFQCSCDNGTFDKSMADNFRRCGSTKRHFLAIATCYDGIAEKSKCSNLLMHCKDGWNMYGVCKGGCKRGFDGKQCLEKIPTSCDLGPCPKGTSKCVETYDDEDDVDGINDFNCTCNLGYIQVNDTACIAEYSSMTIPDITTTVSEYITESYLNFTEGATSGGTVIEIPCSNKKECGTANTKCIVTGSTFKCVCEEGYVRDDLETDCFDLDECSYGPCNLVRSTCENQEGSFECFCKKGYVQLSQDTCSINSSSSEQQYDFWYIHTALYIIIIPLVAVAMLLSLRLFFVDREDGF